MAATTRQYAWIEFWAALVFAGLALVWETGPWIVAVVVVAGLVTPLVALRLAGTLPERGSAEQSSGAGIGLTLLAVILGAWFVAWYVGDPGLVRVWSAGIAGALVGAGAWALGNRSGLARHRVLAMTSIMWGFTVAVTWGDRGGASVPIFLWGAAVAFAVSGGAALLADRRRTAAGA